MRSANSMPRLSGPALVEVIERNLVEALTSFGRLTRAAVHDSTGITWFATEIPLPRFNGVVRTQLPKEGIDEAIRETLAHFQTRGLPMVWWTGPSTKPDDLGARLLEHGLIHAGETPGMALDLGVLDRPAVPPLGLTIERVRDESTLAHYIETLVRGFGDPDWVGRAVFDFLAMPGYGDHPSWRHYVGYLDGKPVACSTLFLGSDSAGIYNVATVAEARGRGIGTAMTASSLSEARAMGHRIGVLHSSAPGLNMYRRLGFQECYQFGTFVWLPDGTKS